jgi:DNA-binding CsgD family transcriptional regulator
MRPLIVIERDDDALFHSTIAEVTAAGWRRHDDLELGPGHWDVTDQRIVCTGQIELPAAVSDALLSVARGAGLVALLRCDARTKRSFLHDLRRIGPVELRTEDEVSPILSLTEEQLRLIELLATGSTVGQAADRINRSRRTTDRLLAAARDALQVGTNAEAVTLLRSRLDRWRDL